MQTILVPVEKNNLWSSRNRGYSARLTRDVGSFAEQHRTRSGGWNKSSNLDGEQLAAAKDLIGS